MRTSISDSTCSRNDARTLKIRILFTGRDSEPSHFDRQTLRKGGGASRRGVLVNDK